MAFEDRSSNGFNGLEEKNIFLENFDRDRSDVTVTDLNKYSIFGITRFLLIKNEEDNNK